MTDSAIPLEYPDYRRLSRSGDAGRVFESRFSEAPKIFCPFTLRVVVNLGKSRNGVGLSSADMLDVAESSLGISEDTIIDVYGDDRDAFNVSIRTCPPATKIEVGQTFSAARHDVTLTVEAIEDTSDDDSTARRSAIETILNGDTLADAVYVTLPQTWVIPDPEFRPRTSTLPLYPGSFWLNFFKSVWGVVNGASIVFGVDGLGNVGLAVKFKEVKAMRQCVLTLHDRYLVHPKEGYGMKMPHVKVVRNATVTAKRNIPGGASGLPGVFRQAHMPQMPINSDDHVRASAIAYANGKDVPMPVADAFQKILEKVEKLDRENQRLLSLLIDEREQAEEFAEIASTRERSPRGKRLEIPATGLPPWRAPK